MKKQFLFTLLIFSSAFSFAQLRSAKVGSANSKATSAKPAFGVRAGVLSSGIRGEAAGNFKDLLEFADGMITTNNRTGFYAGGYASIPISEGIYLEPGVSYSQKGYELKGKIEGKGIEFLGVSAKATLESEYIDIPVVLKANLGSGLQLFAGPQFSYLMKANLKTSAGLLGIDLLNHDMDVSEQFNRWDAAVTGGIGYKLSNGINISASYDYGLSKIDKNQNSKAYNHAFKIGIGLEL